jgi:hypothetical protein
VGDLTTFDPKAVEAAIAGEIKDRFAGMVPAEAWRGLVKKHIDTFLSGKGPGTLEEMVQKNLSEKVKQELDAYFSNVGPWGSRWEDGKQVASKEIELLVMKNMPEIIARVLQGSIQSVLENMRQHMVRY